MKSGTTLRKKEKCETATKIGGKENKDRVNKVLQKNLEIISTSRTSSPCTKRTSNFSIYNEKPDIDKKETKFSTSQSTYSYSSMTSAVSERDNLLMIAPRSNRNEEYSASQFLPKINSKQRATNVQKSTEKNIIEGDKLMSNTDMVDLANKSLKSENTSSKDNHAPQNANFRYRSQ